MSNIKPFFAVFLEDAGDSNKKSNASLGTTSKKKDD